MNLNTETEVNDLYFATIADKNVLKFQIAMADVICVHDCHGIDELFEVVAGCFFGQTLLWTFLFYHLVKALSADKLLHNAELSFFGFEVCIQSWEVTAIEEFHTVNLLLYSLALDLVQLLKRVELEGYSLLGLLVCCKFHCCVGTCTQDSLYSKVVKCWFQYLTIFIFLIKFKF